MARFRSIQAIILIALVCLAVLMPALRAFSMTEEEFGKLSEEQQKKVPVVDMEMSIGRELLLFFIGNALYELRYYDELPTGKENPKLTDAIQQFQTQIGAKPTGKL